MLKARNLVYTIPGLGTFVSKVESPDAVMLTTYIPDPKSESDLLNIMELRLSIEPLNAAFAARRATEEQLEKLRMQHQLLMNSATAEIFAESDSAFHFLLAEATGNPMVVDVMTMVQAFLQEQQVVTSQQLGRRERALKYHVQIFDAVCRGNALTAENVMREHMDDTYIYIKSIVDLSERRSGRWPMRGERDSE